MYTIRVGTGKACINPPEELYPIHRYENYYFEGILEDLHSRAVVVDNGTDKFLFLSLDCRNAPMMSRSRKFQSDTISLLSICSL